MQSKTRASVRLEIRDHSSLGPRRRANTTLDRRATGCVQQEQEAIQTQKIVSMT